MTNERIAELRALEQAATPGPWERWAEHADFFARVKKNTRGVMIGERVGECTDDSDEGEALAFANADFIVAARTAVPELLDENERLRDLIGRLHEALDLARARGQYDDLLAEAREAMRS